MASMLYDALLLLALLFVATLIYILLFGSATQPPERYVLQFYLWVVSGSYFIWAWRHGGQTLAMQTWRIQVTDRRGERITLRQALVRYFCATLFFGPTFVWSFFDREGLFLHDRLSGCQLVLTDKPKKGRAV